MIRRAPLPADIRHRLPRLAEVFRDDVQVAAVYLFGSFARGTEGPLSDVDIAILLEPRIDRARLAALTLHYTQAVLATLGTDEVSVVMLDTAPLPLRYRVIRDGLVLLDRSPTARRDFEVQTQSAYFDFKPALDAYDDELLRQLQAPRA
jgi:predicted nucleotidyltransferase